MALGKLRHESAWQLSFRPDHWNSGSAHWEQADFEVLKIWVRIPSGSYLSYMFPFMLSIKERHKFEYPLQDVPSLATLTAPGG